MDELFPLRVDFKRRIPARLILTNQQWETFLFPVTCFPANLGREQAARRVIRITRQCVNLNVNVNMKNAYGHGHESKNKPITLNNARLHV